MKIKTWQFLKSHPIKALGYCISAMEPEGYRADIHRSPANIGCNINIAIL